MLNLCLHASPPVYGIHNQITLHWIAQKHLYLTLHIVLQCSHVMAMAVQKLFPGAQVTIGPAIERGFYYDFDMPEPITEKDLKSIKQEMQRIIKADLPFVREEVSVHSAARQLHILHL